MLDLGPVRVVALNALPGRGPHLAADEVAEVCVGEWRAPLVAFLHWRHEGAAPPARRSIGSRGSLHGASAALGALPHVASDGIEVTGRMPWVHLLGNFLFDQSGAG